jgi:hypothetical protein
MQDGDWRDKGVPPRQVNSGELGATGCIGGKTWQKKVGKKRWRGKRGKLVRFSWASVEVPKLAGFQTIELREPLGCLFRGLPLQRPRSPQGHVSSIAARRTTRLAADCQRRAISAPKRGRSRDLVPHDTRKAVAEPAETDLFGKWTGEADLRATQWCRRRSA